MKFEDGSVIAVSLYDGVKCPRCWKRHKCEHNFVSLCDRCCDVLLSMDNDTLSLGDHEGQPITLGEVKIKIRESFQKQREIYGI